MKKQTFKKWKKKEKLYRKKARQKFWRAILKRCLGWLTFCIITSSLAATIVLAFEPERAVHLLMWLGAFYELVVIILRHIYASH